MKPIGKREFPSSSSPQELNSQFEKLKADQAQDDGGFAFDGISNRVRKGFKRSDPEFASVEENNDNNVNLAPVGAEEAVTSAIMQRLPALEIFALEQFISDSRNDGAEFDVADFRNSAMDIMSVYIEAISSVEAGNPFYIQDIQELVGGLELVEASDDLDDVLESSDGETVFGLSLMDTEDGPAKIILSSKIEGKPALLRNTAIQELAERMYQEISGKFSMSDFGDEIAGRMGGTLNQTELDELRAEY